MDQQHLKWNLRELMDERGLTIGEVARLSGLQVSTVRNIYRGSTTRVDMPTVDALAAVLGVRPTDVFSDV